jgi:hypothetical protein
MRNLDVECSLGGLQEDVRNIVDDEHERPDAEIPLPARDISHCNLSHQANVNEKPISRIVTMWWMTCYHTVRTAMHKQ